MTSARILATGSKFVGRGVRGTEPVIEEIIRGAKKEIHIVAYVFTSSASRFIDLIEEAAARGIAISIIMDGLETQRYKAVFSRLQRMPKTFHNVKITCFNDAAGGRLHAKVVISDRSKAVIGSANFTKGGMVGNYEIGVLIEGKEAWQLAELVEILST